jgi:putative transposase
MPKKKYRGDLNAEEREHWEQRLRRGRHATRQVTRARILLKAADGGTDEAIAQALHVGRSRGERIRPRFVEGGLEALRDRPHPGKKPQLNAKGEARLIAEACRVAPAGRQRWTLALLADRVVELKLAESYSYEAVRRVLKKPPASLGASSSGACPR